MNIGLIGPPRSGKTTVFHLLTGTEPHPEAEFKREALRAMTEIPDERVDRIAEISASKKHSYISIEYVDTPGIEEGASKQNWFEATVSEQLKQAQALLLVVRDFHPEDAPHAPDPLKDIRSIQDELVFADLVVVEKRLTKLQKQRRVKPPTAHEKQEMAILERAQKALEEGTPLRRVEFEPAEKKILRGFQLLSEKPLLAVINVSEDKLKDASANMEKLNESLQDLDVHCIALSAQIEGEIAVLDEDERQEFMADLQISETARDRVVRGSFDLLGMQTFLTTGEKETRAWPLERGGSALEAAEEIHTDMARGFIRAEVVHYDEFVAESGYAGCRAKGMIRLEGKEYEVKDGDVLLIRHSG